MHRTCILAVTNNQVKNWNAIIQKLNRNAIKLLKSYDSFDEVVDYTYDYLKAPLHQLELKVDDICII